jgi:hypothetical protein
LPWTSKTVFSLVASHLWEYCFSSSLDEIKFHLTHKQTNILFISPILEDILKTTLLVFGVLLVSSVGFFLVGSIENSTYILHTQPHKFVFFWQLVCDMQASKPVILFQNSILLSFAHCFLVLGRAHFFLGKFAAL